MRFFNCFGFYLRLCFFALVLYAWVSLTSLILPVCVYLTVLVLIVCFSWTIFWFYWISFTALVLPVCVSIAALILHAWFSITAFLALPFLYFFDCLSFICQFPLTVLISPYFISLTALIIHRWVVCSSHHFALVAFYDRQGRARLKLAWTLINNSFILVFKCVITSFIENN